MKKIYLAYLAVILSAGGLSLASRTTKSLADLGLSNVCALAEDEENKVIHCTRIKSTANCYNNSDGKWCCLRVKEVEEYTIPVGGPFKEEHAIVTYCPSGTHEGN